MYVIGTAGHVDHGKSTLVKTLTGIDPDRWEEERRREMTIDLGFAWLTLPSGRSVSIIDVPGHERFIKNMLAGVGAIDAALLVVAADEALMPQTEEHLAILDLLGIERGLVVLTKADLVDAEWLGLVGEELRARLAGTSMAAAPQVIVSARSGQGIAELLAALDAQLDQIPPRAEASGAPRMSIDRSFTIGGFGAVVTGTLLDGPLRLGDEVEIVPTGLRARVRGLQTHQQKEEVALPGTRVAVNLAGVSHNDLARGDMLALPGRVRASNLLDARLRMIAGAARPLRHNDRLDLFVGAAETACRVALLDADALAPGDTGWVQLRLDRPIAVSRGDRYILRQPSPSQTLGGGRVIDTAPARHRRFRAEVVTALAALAQGRPDDLLLRVLGDGMPHAWGTLVQASGLTEQLAVEALDTLLNEAKVRVLEPGAKATKRQSDTAQASNHSFSLPAVLLISTHGWARLAEKLRAALSGYHRRYPLRNGMPREELRSRLKLNGDALEAVLAAAVAQGLAATQAASVRLPEHTPTLPPEHERVVRRLLDAFGAAPFGPPPLDLEPELAGWLVEQGQVVRVAPDVAFLPQAYAEMVGWVRDTIRREGSVTVAQFRDHFGSSRKYALALLEHLDERKVTRRAGDARVLY
ncbi:MAG: selenocysteine-specific translation elongation factor [Kouleothrix sp.]|jgi:selenocysteine-specific elongation factor|nr:selenocysteine-specific translation elongation factor [Kouleothrix sp.]